MLVVAGALGALLGATNAGLLAYYVSLGLMAIPCSAYIVYAVAREEDPEAFRRWRRARESRRRG